MTRKHRTAEYQRNARTIRARVAAIHAQGGAVPCWRCRRAITKQTPYDVGHLPGARGSAEHELAPEHRHRTGSCTGNRAAGGAEGAALTNARHTPTTEPAKPPTTWKI